MSVTHERLSANKAENALRRAGRVKPGWPTVVRRVVARNMAYLQRRYLTRAFNPEIRVLKPGPRKPYSTV